MQEYVPKIREGNAAAFRDLFYAVKDPLFGYACKLCKSPELAEEVVQEVFMKLWINRLQLKEELREASDDVDISDNAVTPAGPWTRTPKARGYGATSDRLHPEAGSHGRVCCLIVTERAARIPAALPGRSSCAFQRQGADPDPAAVLPDR